MNVMYLYKHESYQYFCSNWKLVIFFFFSLKASKHKGYLRNGLKDVQKHIRKGETG